MTYLVSAQELSMGLWGFRRRQRSRAHFRGADDWDSTRKDKISKEYRVSSSRDDVKSLVDAQHWLSVVCFMEGVDPKLLLLSPELAGRVDQELQLLKALDPLDVYASALQRFSDLRRVEVVVSEPSHVDCH